MGDKKWRASSDGPDWTDVLTTMRAIEDLHRVAVVVGLHGIPGQLGVGVLHITALVAESQASVLGVPILDTSEEWPSSVHKTVEACLYAGLLRLDHLLSSKVWQQNKLPFTAE